MVRPCLICNDCIYKDGIELKLLEGKRITEILHWLKDKDDRVSYKMIWNHKKKHIPSIHKTSDMKKKMIEEELSASIDSVRSLRNNLDIVNKQISDKLKGSLDKNEEVLLLRFLNESRQIMSEIRSWIKDIGYEPKELETLEDRIMYCIGDFSLDYKKQFLQRWEQYNKEHFNN